MVVFSHFQLTQKFGEEPANDNLIISIVYEMKVFTRNQSSFWRNSFFLYFRQSEAILPHGGQKIISFAYHHDMFVN